MREVFDELIEKYPDAATITVRHRGERSAGEAKRANPLEEMVDSFETVERRASVEEQRAALNRELRYRGGL
jgi:hypothetical protein